MFGTNPEGVVTVRFREEEAARACVVRMHGRFFGGRQLQAAMWDGFSNFHVRVTESEEEQAARLERFAAELEAGALAKAAAERGAAGGGGAAAAAGGGERAAADSSG